MKINKPLVCCICRPSRSGWGYLVTVHQWASGTRSYALGRNHKDLAFLRDYGCETTLRMSKGEIETLLLRMASWNGKVYRHQGLRKTAAGRQPRSRRSHYVFMRPAGDALHKFRPTIFTKGGKAKVVPSGDYHTQNALEQCKRALVIAERLHKAIWRPRYYRTQDPRVRDPKGQSPRPSSVN